jgi:glycosyltransferase involved in cell wall biosynthesis
MTNSPAAAAAAAADYTVLVPVRNERESLPGFHDRVRALGFADRVLYVDNASSDGTVDLLRRLGSGRVLVHERDLGYGASIRDGIAADRAAKVVVLDADLEYPPEAVPRLLAALDRHPVVYASRFRGERPPDMPWLRRAGNRAVTALFNLLFRQRTTDLYTGMKGLRREVCDQLELERTGFEHVVELAAQVARAGHAIAEIDVVYSPRQAGRSKMRHLPETVKCLALLLRLALAPRREDGRR